jgi:hypothetical protein
MKKRNILQMEKYVNFLKKLQKPFAERLSSENSSELWLINSIPTNQDYGAVLEEFSQSS